MPDPTNSHAAPESCWTGFSHGLQNFRDNILAPEQGYSHPRKMLDVPVRRAAFDRRMGHRRSTRLTTASAVANPEREGFVDQSDELCPRYPNPVDFASDTFWGDNIKRDRTL